MLKRDMTDVHDAPPKSISKQRTAGERNSAMLKMTVPNVTVARESNISEDIFERVRCRTIAPATAPSPKNPSRKPYVIGFVLMDFTAVGKSAQKELVKKMRIADRSRSVRIPGE
jgi:hypothetical protein